MAVVRGFWRFYGWVGCMALVTIWCYGRTGRWSALCRVISTTIFGSVCLCQVLSELTCLTLFSRFGGGGFLGFMVFFSLRWVVGAGHLLVIRQEWAVVCPVPGYVYNTIWLGFLVPGSV